jgi:hypothetical protein
MVGKITVQVPSLNNTPTGISWAVYGRDAVVQGAPPGATARGTRGPTTSGSFDFDLTDAELMAADPDKKAVSFEVNMDDTAYYEPDGGQRLSFTWRTCWFAPDVQDGDLEQLRRDWIALHREKVGNYIDVPKTVTIDTPGLVY